MTDQITVKPTPKRFRHTTIMSEELWEQTHDEWAHTFENHLLSYNAWLNKLIADAMKERGRPG